MIIAGIDYSITSPAICVGEVGAPFEECRLYSFGPKKYQGDCENITIDAYPSWNLMMERYHLLSEWSMKILEQHIVEHVGIEGYSFGSKGKVFNLAENAGVLKYKIWQRNIELLEIPPTTAKKFATGKGNANKEALYQSFLDETSYDIKGKIGDTKKGVGNPVSDLVDAYYMFKFLSHQIETSETQ